MKKKRPRRPRSYILLGIVVAGVALGLAAYALVPKDFPGTFLVGSTAVLSINVLGPDGEDDSGSQGEPSHDTGGVGPTLPQPTPIVPNPTPASCGRIDINNDGTIDLADFSILAYWFTHPLSEAAAPIVDLNCDGKVTLIDFSILAYYWTQ